MMCTPFLVHTYAFAYDVHDVFSVHVCHPDILSCDDCTFFPIFLNFYEVYTKSIHSLGALQHYSAWNFTGILHILAQCCLHDRYIKEYYILSGSMEIITSMFIKSIQRSLHLSLHTYVMVVIEIACCVP